MSVRLQAEDDEQNQRPSPSKERPARERANADRLPSIRGLPRLPTTSSGHLLPSRTRAMVTSRLASPEPDWRPHGQHGRIHCSYDARKGGGWT
jgi:hypothetical protein